MRVHTATEHEAAELLAFEHYLRTGLMLDAGDLELLIERKFNPYHDPDNGRFTFGPGGQTRAKPSMGHAGVTRRHRSNASMSAADVKARAKRAMSAYNAERARGKSPAEAAAWAASADAESNSNPRQHQQPSGPGRGLFQWGDNDPKADRRITFQRVMNQSIDHSTIDQQLDFRDWELSNTHRSAKHAIDSASTVAEKVHAITNYYTKPRDRSGATRDRTAIANEILRRDVSH